MSTKKESVNLAEITEKYEVAKAQAEALEAQVKDAVEKRDAFLKEAQASLDQLNQQINQMAVSLHSLKVSRDTLKSLLPAEPAEENQEE